MNLDVYIEGASSETVICVVTREHDFSEMQAHIVAPVLEAVMEIRERKRTETCRGVQGRESYVCRGSDYT